jgi:hypothetical protein
MMCWMYRAYRELARSHRGIRSERNSLHHAAHCGASLLAGILQPLNINQIRMKIASKPPKIAHFSR